MCNFSRISYFTRWLFFLGIFLQSLFVLNAHATSYPVVPQSYLGNGNTNCEALGEHSDCGPVSYTPPSSTIGAISNTILNFYTNNPSSSQGSIDWFILGEEQTQGAYINCTASYSDCLNGKPGSYTTTKNLQDATANQSMVATSGGSRITDSNGNPYYCPLTVCDINSPAISGVVTYNKQQYPFTVSAISSESQGITGISVASGKQEVNISDIGLTFRAITMQSQVCATMLLPAGYHYLFCQNYSYTANQPPLPNQCYGNTACSTLGQNHSLFFVSLTGRLMECIKGTLEYLFNGATSNCPVSKGQAPTSLLTDLQDGLRPAVMAAILLYTVLFGINLALGDQLVSKGEVLGYMVKIIAVLYFSIGIQDSSGKYQNGINKYVFNGFYAMMNSFTGFIMNSSSGSLCNFAKIADQKPNPYIDSEGKDYSFLALWDSLDCRLSYYLGLPSFLKGAKDGSDVIQSSLTQDWKKNYDGITGNEPAWTKATKAGMETFVNLLGDASALILIALSVLTFEILFLLLMGVFAIFILSVALYFVKLFAMAMVALAIMSYLAVIFVPFALFDYTKPYFQSWLNILFSFSLQPVVVAAFMSILMGIFDEIVFTGCQANPNASPPTSSCWTPFNVSLAVDDVDINTYWWMLDGKNCSSDCQKSYGSILYGPNNFITTKDAIFFSIPVVSGSAVGSLFPGLLKAVMFMFFFYFFAKKIGEFAAEVTSGPEINAGDAMELFDAALNAATGGAKKQMDKASKSGMKGAAGKGGGSGMSGATRPGGPGGGGK